PARPGPAGSDRGVGERMRIKQIELTGFKSFMDRTVLELPAGVTAIVGPNGCGKSNVVDAIRWVLGEQSPKHLRGGAMEDVIFAGNADNGPLGMAEGSLLLERTDEDLARAAETSDELPVGPESLPPELAQASEVVVTRRYFRSGDSEYFINKVPCRLKDITELFLGTGVGTRAYAIIEQGRVEQIVNAKPEALRLFLEEAAGITRFRSRRLAAERKMERTRDNLVRVNDVLRELERQMGSLQRQARRAEEYHRIKGALRDLDLRVMAARRRSWEAEGTSTGVELASLRGEDDRLPAGPSSAARARRAMRRDAVAMSVRRCCVRSRASSRSSGLPRRRQALVRRPCRPGGRSSRRAPRAPSASAPPSRVGSPRWQTSSRPRMPSWPGSPRSRTRRRPSAFATRLTWSSWPPPVHRWRSRSSSARTPWWTRLRRRFACGTSPRPSNDGGRSSTVSVASSTRSDRHSGPGWGRARASARSSGAGRKGWSRSGPPSTRNRRASRPSPRPSPPTPTPTPTPAPP